MCKWFKWCISDLRSVSARMNARGYPCANCCNSSASQWLSREQVRLCSGHPKVHFGTIVEGSWGGGRGGGVGARWVLRALSLILCECDLGLQYICVMEQKTPCTCNEARNAIEIGVLADNVRFYIILLEVRAGCKNIWNLGTCLLDFAVLRVTL